MEFLGDDIKTNDSGDLVIGVGSGDFGTASGLLCLLQDVVEEFSFPYLDDPDHPDRGNRFMQFVHSNPMDKVSAIEMKQEAKRILSRDPRINKESISIIAQPGSEGYVSMTFDTVDGKTVENFVVPLFDEAQL